MKKIKNKFIFTIILLIVSIFGYQVYGSYFKIDTNSYVTLIKGDGLLNEKNLIINKKEIIKSQDKVKTIGKDSLAVIEWGDSSITRLAGNTELIIKQNTVSKDLLSIKISFDTKSGKTWSKVVSLMTNGSYFKQYIDDNEAAVRGTVFEVDKENQYIYVQNHQVLLKNRSGREFSINENSPFSLDTFSFIDISKFINEYFDKSWEDLNKNLDNELTKKIKISFETSKTNVNSLFGIFSDKYDVINSLKSGDSIDVIKQKISNLDDDAKKFVFDSVLTDYQKLNSLTPKDENYSEKIKYKDVLINTSYDKENTKTLFETTIFDINSIISSRDFLQLNDTLSLLSKNQNIIKNNNLNIGDYLSIDKQIPESLKEILKKNFDPLKNILNLDNIDLFKVSNLDNIKNSIKDDATDRINSLIKVIK